MLPPPASRAPIGLPAPTPVPAAPTQPIPAAGERPGHADRPRRSRLPRRRPASGRPAPIEPIALGDGLDEGLPLLPDFDALPPDPFAPPALPPAPAPWAWSLRPWSPPT
ncbi:MAG: hypothetical protein U0P46_11720 [Holophagaceae bacterium]